MELQFGVFGFLQITCAETTANNLCLQSLHAVQCFMRAYLQAETAVEADNIIQTITGKPETPQLKCHAGWKMALILESQVATHIGRCTHAWTKVLKYTPKHILVKMQNLPPKQDFCGTLSQI